MLSFEGVMAPTILQLIPELNVGGAEKTVLEMVEAIRAEGWHALVVSEGGRLVPKIEAAGGEVMHLPVKSKNPYWLWRNGHFLKNLIVQRGVDLVHARSRAPAPRRSSEPAKCQAECSRVKGPDSRPGLPRADPGPGL